MFWLHGIIACPLSCFVVTLKSRVLVGIMDYLIVNEPVFEKVLQLTNNSNDTLAQQSLICICSLCDPYISMCDYNPSKEGNRHLAFLPFCYHFLPFYLSPSSLTFPVHSNILNLASFMCLYYSIYLLMTRVIFCYKV